MSAAPAIPRQRGAGSAAVFLAVLGPMSTVPALRKLLLEVHGGSPALLQWFVVVGMFGSLVGAPLLARRADAHGNHLRLAAQLALLDVCVALLTASAVPTPLLFLLRAVHGAASMGVLALLFARFRGSRRELVSRAGGSAIVALAFGPALGGILTKLGPAVPFQFAAGVSLLLSATLALNSSSPGTAPSPRAKLHEPASVAELARALRVPLLLIGSQRFAIGGLVAALAVHLRAKHGFSDARVGMCFSIFLVAFALGTWGSGKALGTERSVARIVPGALLFASAFALFGFVSPHVLLVALALAGFGASLVYAPCLALLAETAAAGSRATAMAMFHAAGGVGMVLGPLGALVLDYVLRSWGVELRTAAFMLAGGAIHALVVVWLAPSIRRMAGAGALRQASATNYGVGAPARRSA